MNRPFLFLLLIFYPSLSLAWIIKTLGNHNIFSINNSEMLKNTIQESRLDYDFKSSEIFSIIKFHRTRNVKIISRVTIIKFDSYKWLIRKFGDLVFSPAMKMYGIEEFHFERAFDFVKLIWVANKKMNDHQNDQIHLAFIELFNNLFSKILNNVHHLLSPPSSLIKLSLISKERIEMTKLNILEQLENKNEFWRIYSKSDFEFNGELTLMCSLVIPEENEFFTHNNQMFKGDLVYKKYIRFGAYQSGDSSPLRSFMFYQTKSDSNIDKRGQEYIKRNYVGKGNTRVIILHPPENIKTMIEFMKFITDQIICYCH